jgi:hypothetical protein
VQPDRRLVEPAISIGDSNPPKYTECISRPDLGQIEGDRTRVLKLARFCGHPTFGVFGVHNGKKAPARSNASCSIAIASRRRPKRALLSSSSSRVSTIRADDTHRSGICHPSSSSANLQMRPSNPGHTSMLSCSRLSRSGLETSQQASPSTCRPSLTAARHDSLGNVQAGTKRCSRPNQKITQKRRQSAVKLDTLIPRPHLSTKPEQAQDLARTKPSRPAAVRRLRQAVPDEAGQAVMRRRPLRVHRLECVACASCCSGLQRNGLVESRDVFGFRGSFAVSRFDFMLRYLKLGPSYASRLVFASPRLSNVRA